MSRLSSGILRKNMKKKYLGYLGIVHFYIIFLPGKKNKCFKFKENFVQPIKALHTARFKARLQQFSWDIVAILTLLHTRASYDHTHTDTIAMTRYSIDANSMQCQC